MRSLLFATVSLSSLVLSHPNVPQIDLHRRNIIYDGNIADSYDFVIAGGGNAGLVLASRLSEDSNTTVLVLEAGDTGDAVKDRIDVPSDAYFNGLLYSSYDWQFKTVPQTNAAGRVIPWARGKVLGGCTAVNGMYQVRPSKLEVDAWAGLIDGGDLWNWDSLFSVMQDSETFTPPTDEVKNLAKIQYNTASQGSKGPIHVTYPGYELPIMGNWTDSLNANGVPPSADAYGGENWGGFIATSAINPTNWTRSYARSAYIDPLPYRANLAILANATVTKIVFTNTSAGAQATAVEYASDRSATVKTIKVNKEVIVAGGAIGSPHILQLSGIGPSDVLTAAGVPVTVNLPGVGQHLQDHISTAVTWNATIQTYADQRTPEARAIPAGTSNAFLSYINSATAYVNASTLVGVDKASDFYNSVAGALSDSASKLVPSTDATVIEGYKAIYNVTANTLLTPVGQVEILLSLSSPGTISIQAALQHPFSQGRLYINSSNPFDYPVIDPGYLTHSADLTLMREGLKFARQLGNTAPINANLGPEVTPGAAVVTDDDWDKWLAGVIGTEFHPSCSCAMLPKEKGGVVDAKLKVYGTTNVRVADAAVFPIQFSAHLQAPVYGLGEQAARIIRSQYNGTPLPSASSGAGSPTGSNSPQQTGTKNGAVSALSGHSMMWAAVAVIFGAVLGF